MCEQLEQIDDRVTRLERALQYAIDVLRDFGVDEDFHVVKIRKTEPIFPDMAARWMNAFRAVERMKKE